MTIVKRLNELLNPLHVRLRANPETSSLTRRLGRATLILARNCLQILTLLYVLFLISTGLPAGAIAFSSLILGGSIMLFRRIRSGLYDQRLDLVLYGAMIFFFGNLRSFADDAGQPVSFQYVIDLERFVSGGTVPTIWLQEQLYHIGTFNFLDILLIIVYFSYFIMPLVTPVILWKYRPHDLSQFMKAMFLGLILGTIAFFLLPTAPPWLAAERGYLPEVHRVVLEAIQGIQPDAYQKGYEAVGPNDVASMPSFHIAETLLVVLALSQFGRLASVIGAAYVGLMALALVYLGEHYVVDAGAGLLLAGIAWRLAQTWQDVTITNTRKTISPPA
jgi:hypothetical protein